MGNHNDEKNRDEPTGRKLHGQAAFLDKALSDRIDSFQVRRKQNRRLSFRLKIWATILSAVTTVLLGLQGVNLQAWVEPAIRDLALVVSSIVTVLGACEAFYDYRGLWVRYTETRARLLSLRARLQFLSNGDGALSAKVLEDLFEAYERILGDSNDAWLRMRRQSSHNGGASELGNK
jgi:hypothetical protein